MFTALTPESLIQERVAAFQRCDFSSIFYSYHTDAPFLHFFPDCDTYLAYAEAEIASSFVIESCQILRSTQQEETAYVLFRQRLRHQGVVCDSFEIARCQRGAGERWFFEAGLRLDERKFPGDFLACSWEDLFAAGSDLWI